MPFLCALPDLSDPVDDSAFTPDPIKINEVMSSNAATLIDQFNESPDWIELHNTADTTVALNRYGLSDRRDDPAKWQCGTVVLEPKGYVIVCASGRDITTCSPETVTEVDLTDAVIGPWADNQNNPAGNSFVRPVMFTGGVHGIVDGKRIVSALLYLDDNSGIINWQDAYVRIEFRRTLNYTAYDRVRITGTIEKGKPLRVHVLQLGLEDWLSYSDIIIGTGVTDDSYDIRISNEPRLDLTRVEGFMVAAEQVNDSVTFTITGIALVQNASYLHANFKLAAEGETIVLTNPSGKLVDLQQLTPLGSGISQGRKPGEPLSWVVFDTPTPGSPNHPASFKGSIVPVTESVASGFFFAPLQLRLICEGAQIRYTLDGSLPDEHSPAYAGPLSIDTTTVVRYRGFAPERAPGPVTTATYFINDASGLAVIALAVEPGALFDPDTGIYMKGALASDTSPYFGANFWKEKEVPVHIAFFEPGGLKGFSCNVGLRIFGNYSRQNPKKSVSLFFRRIYGRGTLVYPLFPDAPDLRRFESCILRNNGGNFQRAMFEDALAGRLAGKLNLDHQKYRPVVVYINGRYWGIHNLREKLNASYIVNNHGYAENEIDFIKAYGEVEAGDKIHYEELLHYLRVFGVSLDEHYQHVAEQMNIDNYITYVTAEIYFANTDWPANNNGWWRPRTARGTWKWVVYDLDGGFGSWGQPYDINMLTMATDSTGPEWPNPPWSTFMLRTLLKNGNFKRRFINRAATLLATTFHTDSVTTLIEAMAANIQSEIPRDFDRWEMPESRWSSSVAGLARWAANRPAGMRSTYVSFFNLSGTARFTLDVTGHGVIDIDGITPGFYPHTGVYFIGNPLKLTARASSGAFRQWSDGSTDTTRMIDLTEDRELVAQFD
ncbi:MAG: CotH kinase family protein [Chitinispirillaceae bacterium]|nr:CotH kinase family protein [Chitinispirillaceae bacterium]